MFRPSERSWPVVYDGDLRSPGHFFHLDILHTFDRTDQPFELFRSWQGIEIAPEDLDRHILLRSGPQFLQTHGDGLPETESAARDSPTFPSSFPPSLPRFQPMSTLFIFMCDVVTVSTGVGSVGISPAPTLQMQVFTRGNSPSGSCGFFNGLDGIGQRASLQGHDARQGLPPERRDELPAQPGKRTARKGDSQRRGTGRSFYDDRIDKDRFEPARRMFMIRVG